MPTRLPTLLVLVAALGAVIGLFLVEPSFEVRARLHIDGINITIGDTK